MDVSHCTSLANALPMRMYSFMWKFSDACNRLKWFNRITVIGYWCLVECNRICWLTIQTSNYSFVSHNIFFSCQPFVQWEILATFLDVVAVCHWSHTILGSSMSRDITRESRGWSMTFTTMLVLSHEQCAMAHTKQVILNILIRLAMLLWASRTS